MTKTRKIKFDDSTEVGNNLTLNGSAILYFAQQQLHFLNQNWIPVLEFLCSTCNKKRNENVIIKIILISVGGAHEVMVTEGSIDNFGNIIHVHTSSLQPLQTLQSYTYHPSSSSSGRHSPSDAAAATAAYSSSISDGYQHNYHHGIPKQEHHYHQHHGNSSSASSRMEQNLYNKIEVIPSYKSTLHGATAQVYTALASPSSSGALTYDHTATLYRLDQN